MVYNISQNNSINPTLVSLDFIYAVNNLLELEETKTMAWNTALYQMLNIAEFQSTICWTMVEWHTLVVTSSVWLWMWRMWKKKSILSSLWWLNVLNAWITLSRLALDEKIKFWGFVCRLDIHQIWQVIMWRLLRACLLAGSVRMCITQMELTWYGFVGLFWKA